MGVNQSYEGVRLAQPMINLALMTGNIESLYRREFDYRAVQWDGSRCSATPPACWVAATLPTRPTATRSPACSTSPGVHIREQLVLLRDHRRDRLGEIKGLWLIATNTAHSWINQKRFRRIHKLEFLVVQMFHSTESAEIADGSASRRLGGRTACLSIPNAASV